MLKKICFSCQINLTVGERPNKKNIESLNFTRKVNLLSQQTCLLCRTADMSAVARR